MAILTGPINTNPVSPTNPIGPGLGWHGDYYAPNTGTGGTGGTTGTTALAPTAPTGPTGPSEQEINSVYQPSIDYLNQAEGNLRNDFPNVLDAAQKAYEVAISELSGNKSTNLGTIAENKVQAGQRKEDVLSSARRLYDELRRGYQQRFGGSTSAGAAATELAGNEQQRQMGATNRQYNDTSREIELASQKVETDYQTGVLKLEAAKTQAISQANSDFQNKLLSIAQNRAMVESAKAQARLDALQQLRNQVFQINQQNAQFGQTLVQQKSQQTAQLQTTNQQLAMAGQQSNTATNQFNSNTTTNPISGLTTSQTYGGQQPSQTLTGRIATRREDDPYNTNPLERYA